MIILYFVDLNDCEESKGMQTTCGRKFPGTEHDERPFLASSVMEYPSESWEWPQL